MCYLQTTAPTSFCRTLTVNVATSDIQWNGLYELDESTSSFGVADWNGIESADGAWLKYMGGYWLLQGTNKELLTYRSKNDPDNYPPIEVTKSWKSESKNAYDVTIQCSNTSVPTPAPTDQPTEAPVKF